MLYYPHVVHDVWIQPIYIGLSLLPYSVGEMAGTFSPEHIVFRGHLVAWVEAFRFKNWWRVKKSPPQSFEASDHSP